jgi:DNA-binding transcriptional LysR family regulator
MQLASLKVFCDVARHRSFSQAAQANEITQSAVSHIVSQLERRMDVQLVDRSTRPLQLTTLGQTYYEGCRALLDQYDELEAGIRKAQCDLAGVVEVAAIYSVGLSDLGELTKTFAQQQPLAHVRIEYLHPDRVYERVLAGSADLGLVSFPHKSAKLLAMPWRDEEMVLACDPRHPLARQASVSVADLNGLKYVHFDRNLTIRRKVDRFLKENGAAVEVVHEFDNIENIKQDVAVGAGVALLPEPTLRREVKARELVALPLAGVNFRRPLGIILKRGHWLSGATRAFLDLLQGQSAPPPNGQHHHGNGKPARKKRIPSSKNKSTSEVSP